MRVNADILLAALLMTGLAACAPHPDAGRVKTTFQTSHAWRPTIDNRADAVMVYGVGGNPSDPHDSTSVEERIRSWRERGYRVDFMTGIAWGSYQDYFTGRWDGKTHLDEGQVRAEGDTIWHGPMVPYIVPSLNYLKYFKETQVRRVIDAGVTALYFEEPEFWCWGGYSEAFKREWEEYYHQPWRPQDESPEATYLSGKLKYQLYYRALEEVSAYAKEYGKSKGLDVKCYVPTHSLLNYSQWHIVSPEASLASISGIDGYIAQIWTGTARAHNFYQGVRKERTFENAYLEYRCMASMTAPTGRRMRFLTDPIEDRATDWADYRTHYHATFTAQLLYPRIADYEVMPWPERIYERLYRKSADSEERIRIPQDYSTMMQVMIGTLNEMPLSDNRLTGTQGISVLMGNSLMFQRFPTHDGYDDPLLSNFYGMAMPILKRGIPVGITHIENLVYEETLQDVKVLVMTYSNMKPMDPGVHEHLAEWVKKGGRIIYSSRDTDPFQTVQEWWNTGDCHLAAPADHLFGLMGIPAGAEEGVYPVGEGAVCILRQDPKEYVLTADADGKLMEAVKKMYAIDGGAVEYKNHFRLTRGPYELVAVMDESVSDEPYRLSGLFIDLYDPQLPVYTEKEILPGTQGFYYNVKAAGKAPKILAAASRAYEIKKKGKSFSYLAKAPIGTVNASRILIPSQPKSVLVNGKEVLDNACWNAASKTYFLSFDNDPDGVRVRIRW